jgi:hypothetical protein
MTVMDQLKKVSGPDLQGAWRQDELIGHFTVHVFTPGRSEQNTQR